MTMRANWRLTLVALLVAPALLGCPAENFPNAIDAFQANVDAVVNNTNLTPQERREKLYELGLSPTAVNGLLRSVRLGNQFGGTLRSAYDKVVGGQYAALTPDEIQFYGDTARSTGTGTDFTITDAQAQAVADLFVAQNLNTAQQVDVFINTPGSDIPPTIPNDLLKKLFVEFDPALVVDQF